MAVTLLHGDCLDLLKSLPDNSIDATVTDPPYGLSDHSPEDVAECLRAWVKGQAYRPAKKGFMGRGWDAWVPGPEVWREVYRVLKPGSHVVAFAGTRTMDLMSMAIRLAGFELRDAIGFVNGGAPLMAWTYGTGFPKSHPVAKAIDKAAGVEFEAVAASGVGFMGADGPGGYNVTKNQLKRVGESSDEAKDWEGWGTALKPAWEPIIVARKPLIGTVAENVLLHGTGGLNVDAGRIPLGEGDGNDRVLVQKQREGTWQEGVNTGFKSDHSQPLYNQTGRFPANVIHDGSAEVLAMFDAYGESKAGQQKGDRGTGGIWGKSSGKPCGPQYGDNGSTSRFFYSAKATKEDRAGSEHPTVKPIALMTYLVRLLTPNGGVVLDPFAGSGTTGAAAVEAGFDAVLIEREDRFAADIRNRLGDHITG